MFIAIAGNIGVGKTALTNLLSKHYGWKAFSEEVKDNPYINDFYDDMKRWSFAHQVYFLSNRLKQLLDIQSSKNIVIQDRTIYEDAEVFAANLTDMDLMSERDFQNYLSLYKLMISLIKPPDLLVYLKASVPTLVKRIQKRGRDYEETIRIEYLERLNKKYNNWINNYKDGKLLIIDTNKLDFLERQQDANVIIYKINATLFGLF